MVMENFVSPFIGIPFPMQAESSISENSCLPPSSAHSSAKSRKNSRKRRKLSGMKRIAATTRERSRIEHLNCAFITLRSRIPTQPSDVKLTKVETLRLAMSYILHLEKLVADIEAQEKESTGSSEVSSTSKDSRDETVHSNRLVRVYPSFHDSSNSEYNTWHQQYGLPVRPIPTMEPPFIMKKGHKEDR
uniref:HLH domain-containing protein n=2 Tax=Bathyctena chuni TaxID=1403704 RepID=V9PPD7_BATCU|nr:HLH domain-containing protein [Bathyctena chuni]AHA51236.1 HLH domain-containing protein [Bathyctena chuni]